MQFPRDARPLVDALFQAHVELPRQLMNAELIERPEQCQESCHARQTEPCGLVIRRRDGEIQESAGFVPHTAVVARRHAETVAARRKIAIEGLPASVGVLPIGVPSFQLVAKAHLLGRD